MSNGFQPLSLNPSKPFYQRELKEQLPSISGHVAMPSVGQVICLQLSQVAIL